MNAIHPVGPSRGERNEWNLTYCDRRVQVNGLLHRFPSLLYAGWHMSMHYNNREIRIFDLKFTDVILLLIKEQWTGIVWRKWAWGTKDTMSLAKPLMRVPLNGRITLAKSPPLRFRVLISRMRKSEKKMSQWVWFFLSFWSLLEALEFAYEIWASCVLFYKTVMLQKHCAHSFLSLLCCVCVGIQLYSEHNRGDCYLNENHDDSLWSK